MAGKEYMFSDTVCNRYLLLAWDPDRNMFVCLPKNSACGYPGKPIKIDKTSNLGDFIQVDSLRHAPSDTCWSCPLRPSTEQAQKYIEEQRQMDPRFGRRNGMREGVVEMYK